MAEGQKSESIDLAYSVDTPDKMKTYYNQWYTNYDEEIFEKGIYNGPAILAKFAKQFLKPADKILDVCAGTGLIVDVLAKDGEKWENIDALDASDKMLEKAKEKNLYQKYFCEFVGGDNSSISSGYYDAVIICGAFCPGHLDESHFNQILRYIRSGGYLIFAINSKWLLHNTKESKYNWPHNVGKGIEDLTAQGLWRLAQKTVYENYSEGGPGTCFAFIKN